MNDFTKPLSNAIKQARKLHGLTQEQAAELAGIDTMNITKMESVSRNDNPELSTLYPVIRALSIDSQDIFYPEIKQDNPKIRHLQQLVSDCSEEEADALIPIIRELKLFLRSNGNKHINE